MKVPRLPRLARALPPALAVALVLAASCSAQGVKGFAWKTEDGTSLPFTQGASWPEGAEGRFGPGRQSNTYTPPLCLLPPVPLTQSQRPVIRLGGLQEQLVL